MSRNRVITQSEALFVSPSPSTSTGISGVVTGVQQLFRVQNANYNFNIPRRDIVQFGQLGAISREIIDPPTVALDFSYYLTNVVNEQRLGFVVDGSSTIISGIINAVSDDKNYYLATTPEGTDANGGNPASYTDSQVAVEGFGNGFISSYTAECAVGAIPTARVQVQALNYAVVIGDTGFAVPAVNISNGIPISATTSLPPAVSGLATQITALRPGDITVSITGAIGVSIPDLKPQRFTLTVPLTRESLRKLGTRFDYAKVIQFPINASLTVESLMGDPAAGALSNILCNDTAYNLTVTLATPNCSGAGTPAVVYSLLGAKLDSQNDSTQIGQNKTISTTWSVQITGPTDTARGIFLSGILT